MLSLVLLLSDVVHMRKYSVLGTLDTYPYCASTRIPVHGSDPSHLGCDACQQYRQGTSDSYRVENSHPVVCVDNVAVLGPDNQCSLFIWHRHYRHAS